ncbi:gamma-glutamylputrescine oxidase [Ketogulonicigenium robustum]|uniref:Gamma-glutamylputrescine oxidase n=1 Tax=Ketogulonicigenium robustum TaxID=92947 RepID=A0A1W6NXI6_9RHOB|nr:FAD-binding oxidoreductase [Ketogulonicigenium robustum]ARO13899.1 gamma-glutamylputrescine oxidase [Ketogulonicigenium robustum]
MNPLYRNDRPGEYPASWYAASTTLPPPRVQLHGDHRVDACVIGAGYTGLWAAKTLAERGLRVIVLDAHRAGFGASGRNGGQVGTGYNKGQIWLENRLGETRARALWDIAEDAKAQLVNFCTTSAPEARYRPGVAHGEYSATEGRDVQAETEFLHKRYGYDKIVSLDQAGFQALVKSPLYKAGQLDRGAGHIHPLRYALALANAAEAAGAVIFEQSEAISVTEGAPAVVKTPLGSVTADWVVVAGNGYLPNIVPKVPAHVMPINSFIGATEPLGPLAQQVLAEDIAVADSKFVVNYYRLSEDGRFLFGGRESYSMGFPKDIGTALQARMVSLFPQLKDVRIDHIWGGTLAITMSRLPYVTRVGSNIMSASGYSGHGVALAGMAGRVMAEAILGQAERFDVMGTLPVSAFPGGSSLRAPLLTLAMTWFALRDRLGI